MNACEYTPERAKLLTKLNIPEFELQINTKILWFDVMASSDIDNSHPCTLTHSHSFYEMIFSLSGEILYQYGENTVKLTRHHAILIPPSVPHRLLERSEDSAKTSIAFSLGDNNALSIFDAKEICVSDIVADNTNYILKNIENKNFLFPAIFGGRIVEILEAAFSSLGVSLPETDEKMTDSRILVAKDFINSNKNRTITCEDVAKECCLSTKQLNRIFKSYAGISAFEYIVSTKIKYAKQLLSKTDKSIKEISFMLGFDNESSFNSFFKRHTSFSPGVFRKEISEMSAN